MSKKIVIGISSVVAVGALLLLGSLSSTSSSTSSAPKDIKDLYLTNLSGDCADYASNYNANVIDIIEEDKFVATFKVSDSKNSCDLESNDIPNYDFNDGSGRFADPVQKQNISLSVPRNPIKAEKPTDLSLLFYNGVMLNGVVLDLLSNGCYKPDDKAADENGNVKNGCGLSVDWRLDPMGPINFGTDSHNAHTQPGGLYHYHGNPMALYDPKETKNGSPVIGFAADGFPIYGPHYIDPATKKMSVAKSGYTIKKGVRPTGVTSPGGTYDGTYIQDYEFTNAGTLDQCNGMTVNGQYGYYVTDSYPYVIGCHSGHRDLSFFKFWSIAKWVLAGIIILITLITGSAIYFVRKRRAKRKLFG